MEQETVEELSVLPDLSVAESEQAYPSGVESRDRSPIPGEEDESIAGQTETSDTTKQTNINTEVVESERVVADENVKVVVATDESLDRSSVPEEVKAPDGDLQEVNNTNTPVIEEIKRDPNLVSVTLRPVDNGWVMGEDWVVDLHNQLTMSEIRAYVETHRGISRHRIQLRLKGKVVPANREIWTLRRLGIYDGYTIQVEPTLSGAWLWNPKEYYINKLLNEVCAVVESTVSSGSAGRINLKDLCVKIKPPPCIKTSLRVFLRQYPERIYMHTDTTEGDIWVHITKRHFQLPTFGNFSVEIGTFAYYKPKKFDWAGNKDIDDMYKIETLPEEEEVLLAEQLKEGGEAGENTPGGVSESQKALLAAEASARLVAMGNDDTVDENTAADENNTIVTNELGESLIVAS